MLKMMCPNCHEQIISSLLAEVDEIKCHHCNSGVPVRNILISARGMTINRDDLLKQFFRYKKMLMEIMEERSLMEENVESLSSSKKSADQFIATLEEIMSGARDNYRLQFSLSVPVRLRFDNKMQSGWLVNLSMVGACVETENSYFIPSIGSLGSIEFVMPGHKNSLMLRGMIAWNKEMKKNGHHAHDLGIKFIDVDARMKNDLWHLISSSVYDVLGGQPAK